MCNIKDKDVYDRIFYKKDGEKKMCRICYRNLENNKCPKCFFMNISDFQKGINDDKIGLKSTINQKCENCGGNGYGGVCRCCQKTVEKRCKECHRGIIKGQDFCRVCYILCANCEQIHGINEFFKCRKCQFCTRFNEKGQLLCYSCR